MYAGRWPAKEGRCIAIAMASGRSGVPTMCKSTAVEQYKRTSKALGLFRGSANAGRIDVLTLCFVLRVWRGPDSDRARAEVKVGLEPVGCGAGRMCRWRRGRINGISKAQECSPVDVDVKE